MIIESFVVFMSKIMLFSSYVDNVSSFPKTLTVKEEKEWLAKLRAGDKEAKSVLVSHNLRLVAHIVKKSGTIYPVNCKVVIFIIFKLIQIITNLNSCI